MQLAQIKKLAINTMIASLIGAALVAVISVLVGEFNDTFGKALFTLLVVTVHSLACLGFLENRAKVNNAEELRFFTNTMFILIVLSFVTAVFGIWELFSGELVGKLYGTYFIVAFASLHGEMLFKTQGFDSKVTNIVYANYIFMAIVILLLLPLIWLAGEEFGDFYYRLLAAAAIVDATLTILAVILHRLYIQKHPEAKSPIFSQIVTTTDAQGNKIQQVVEPNHRRIHPFLYILGLFLLLQIIAPVLWFIGSRL
jgi:hypothetical protein